MPPSGGDTEAAHRSFFAAWNSEADRKADARRPQVCSAKTHCRLVEKFVGHGIRFLGGAHLRRKHMRMADRFEMLVLPHVEVFTLKPMPKALPPNRTP